MCYCLSSETKREIFDSSYLKNFCPKRIGKFEYLPSMGAAGGLLVAWNEHIFREQVFHSNNYALSILFTSKHNGEQWILTKIYGPCQQSERINYID